MKLTVRFASLLILPVLICAAPAPAAGPSALDDFTLHVVKGIKAREASLKTFEARFDQIQQSRLFTQIVQSRGIIRYDARGRLLFRITDPAPYAVVFDGDWVYIEDPGQNTIKKHHIGRKENLLKKYFGVGQPLEDLTRRFAVKATSNAPLPGVTLVMRPKEARLAGRVSLISADVDEETWLPKEIFIQQTRDEWTRMHLDFTAVNQPLPPDAFQLKLETPKPNGRRGAKETP